nr:hypothetical protein [Aquincola tertiaricarbonis]
MDLVFRHTLMLHRRGQQATLVNQQPGLRLHRLREPGRAHGQPGDEPLPTHQQYQRRHALGQRHVLGHHDGGQGGAQGRGDDEVERIELGQRALARAAQQQHEEYVGGATRDDGAQQAVPVVEEHAPKLQARCRATRQARRWT